MQKKILNLGSGQKKNNSGIRLDINPDVNPDVVHDLNSFPYPFKDNTFDIITMDNVIGELENLWNVMDEVYRISKVGAKVIISVPYFRSSYAFIHPNIKSFFTIQSFDYFDPENELHKKYKYTMSTFKVEKLKFNEDFKHGIIKSIARYIADKNPQIYENLISHIVPLDAINFYLKKI
jgi:ubiquinone/menaquinone biosynthesis C-methylase UbiE